MVIPEHCSYSLNMISRVSERANRDMEALISLGMASGKIGVANTLKHGCLQRWPHL